jgi:hypothetical protein
LKVEEGRWKLNLSGPSMGFSPPSSIETSSRSEFSTSLLENINESVLTNVENKQVKEINTSAADTPILKPRNKKLFDGL